jgi:hypothetical protein
MINDVANLMNGRGHEIDHYLDLTSDPSKFHFWHDISGFGYKYFADSGDGT